MTNQQILEGNWNEIKGMLRQKWGQLTDNDLPQIRGNLDQIVGIIQRKTGEGREQLNSICKNCPAAPSRRPVRRLKRHETMPSTLPRTCSIRPSRLPTGCSRI